MTNFRKILLFLFFIPTFVSCTSIHEAQHTLDVADSLRTEGITYSDSTDIAKAVATISKVRYFYPSDYARANYYYGRLLRNQGHQPEAMQCFINASHTDPSTPLFKRIGLRYRKISADDYNLLGRVYSNIGTLCHLGDEFTLSYQMYEQCAKQFQKANNTTAYYYALNDMAYELAELKNQGETLAIINKIEKGCNDSAVLSLTNLSKAELYLNIMKYDSAIFYIDKELSYYHYEPTGVMIKAQSFSGLNNKDSAIYYAKYIVDNDHNLNNLSNAYFILQHDDPNITIDSVNQLAANRTDVNDILDIYHSKLAQAIQLFNYDRNQKPNYKLALLIKSIIILVSFLIIFTIVKTKYWRRKQHKSIEKERKIIEYEKEKARKVTEQEQQKQVDLMQQQQHLLQENDTLKQTLTNYKQEYDIFLTQRLNEIENTCNVIRSAIDWKTELHWDDYNELCDFINQHFFLLADKLKALHKLDEKEIRMCTIVLLDMFTSQQIADILYYGKGIRTYKSRINQKLGNQGNDLRKFLIEIAISGNPQKTK